MDLVNIYNANTESEQLKVLNDLRELMKKANRNNPKKTNCLAGNLNLFFDSNLEAICCEGGRVKGRV